MSTGRIKKVAGPLVIAEGMRDANMYDVVRVSKQRLIGEIIEMHGDEASVQVYEETSGLGPGEPVESMEVPLSVELGPGLITSIYDGIQRPLDDIMKVTGGNLLKRGVEVSSLKRDKKWKFEMCIRDRLDDLRAVHIRQSEIQKDEVRALGRGHGQRVGAVVYYRGFIALGKMCIRDRGCRAVEPDAVSGKEVRGRR